MEPELALVITLVAIVGLLLGGRWLIAHYFKEKRNFQRELIEELKEKGTDNGKRSR